MSVVQTLIGNIKGPQGDQGQTGATGATGTAATITVGTTTTTAYGNAAQVTNTGTQSAAVLNFVIPQGRPGQQTTTMGDLTLDSITTSMEDFPSPAINDTGKVAFGKIVKFFSDTLARFTKHAGNVATISSSPTTQAFSTGDFLVYNDQLYKVTANIANGGTLTPGTNTSSTSVGEQLASINTTLAGKADGSVANNLTTTASGYVLDARQGKALNDSLTPTNQASATSFSVGLYGGYIYKIGRIGFISYLSDSTSWTAGTAKTLFTLPNAMKPVGTLYLMAFANSADPAYAFQLQISTGGVATATPNTSGTYRISFTIVFVTNS